MKPSLSRALTLLSAALVVAAAGCAEERPPLDRIQPDALDKSFFVGANLHDTSDDPEFYSQGTLVDVAYGAGQDGLFTSTYAQPMTRIKWVIQENLLIGRLSYERISGSDGKGAGAASDDGVVAAVYPITTHFDIQRDYNPSTGEQTNVLVENTSDRPWYERQYIRVDWSKNLSTDNYDYDTLSQIGVYGGVSYEPLAYFVNDPYSEDAPHFDAARGYFDVTNKAFATPQMIDLSYLGWGIAEFPACYLDADVGGGIAPSGSCAPVELTIRQAFLRVTDTDYEPEDWDGQKFQSYGAFTTDRYGYARNYGMTDSNWHRFINRYNIWERSHYYDDPARMIGAVECYTPETTAAGLDPHRDVGAEGAAGNGTEDECELVGRGSRCDTFKQRCTLPYRDRTAVTQVWYYTTGSNPEFFEASEAATHEWDVAMREAVLTSRYAECQRVGESDCAATYPVFTGQMDDAEDAVVLAREVDDCRNGLAYPGKDCLALAGTIASERGYSAPVVALAKMDEMIVLCHSPVESQDPAICGGPRLPAGMTTAMCELARSNHDRGTLDVCNAALNARKGDIRYHQVNAMTAPQTPSPWGIMVDAHDPLTGEKVSASINVWTHVNDLWAQGVVDVSRYVKGELETEEITEGTYVRDWANAAASATSKGAVPLMDKAEVDQRIADFSGVDKARLAQLRSSSALNAPELKQKLGKLRRDLGQVKADARVTSTNQATYESRRKRALGSPMEAQLSTRMMQELAGTVSATHGTDLERVSPLRGGNPAIRRNLANLKELALAERGACILHEAPAPMATADLADLLEDKFGAFDPTASEADQLARGAKIQKFLARRAHTAVLTHEIGHSIALRHNFVSSSDAWGYRPQYWQLRTKDGTVTNPCTDLDPAGACIGPRYFDPVTADERKNLIYMFMQSSTMDYAGEATQDLLGLGAYDFAATRMFYGGVVSVHADSSYDGGTPRGEGMMLKLDNFGGILGMQPEYVDGDPDTNDSIHYSQLQNRFEMIKDCVEVDASKFKPARYDERRDGNWHPLIDGQLVTVNGKTTRCRQQPVDYVQWQTLKSSNPLVAGAGDRGLDEQGRTRLPYGFGTDSWADVGNLSVYRHDNGADAYEIFDFLITQQEVNHIFDNYRRGRQSFSVRGAANRSLERYNEKLRDGAKGLGLYANIYRDFAAEEGYDYESLWPFIAATYFPDNILASGIAFDHFAKQLQRPQPGPHFSMAAGGIPIPGQVLRSAADSVANAGATQVVIPNGGSGYFGNVAPGGKPVENGLADDKGEYDSQYTTNAGSYYEKAYSAMLMTESVDNFISSSRRDFVDGRYRAVSLADLFPDGYRRWLANNLTGDDALKGPRLEALANRPVLDDDGYPASGMAFTSWWRPDGPESCFAQEASVLCTAAPAQTVVVDPQVGWEQQMFLIAWTLHYLPENQQQNWLDMLHLWEVGADSDPGFPNRIEFHDPTGKTYIARTFGTEVIFGKTVQRGISARVLEYANELLAKAYVVTNGPDLDADGRPDWYIPTLSASGQPMVKFDPTIVTIDENGFGDRGRPGCDATDSSECTCSSNKKCLELDKYVEVPFFLRQAEAAYGLGHPSMRGIY